jgi:hypothetical protein
MGSGATINKDGVVSPGGKGGNSMSNDPFGRAYGLNRGVGGKGGSSNTSISAPEDPNRYYNNPYTNTFQPYLPPSYNFYQPPPQYDYGFNSGPPNSLQYIESQIGPPQQYYSPYMMGPPQQYYSPYMNQFGGSPPMYGPAMQPGGRTDYFRNQMFMPPYGSDMYGPY